MDLIKSYNELYATSKTYNELVVAEKREQKKFADLENFLRQNSDDIKKYGLEAEICKLFNKNADISIKSIKSLIESKRKEEEDRRLREMEEEERRRREREEEERRRREQEEEERRLREERERERLEQERLERQKKIAIIKWVIILIVMVTLTFMSFGIIWILIGFILFKFPNLRNKLSDGMKNDWEKITHK